MVVRAAELAEPPAGYTPPFPADPVLPRRSTTRAPARPSFGGLLAGLQGVSPAYNFMAPATRGECAQLLHNLIVYLAPTTTTTAGPTTTTTAAPTTTTTTVPSGSPIAKYSGSGDDVLDVQKPAGPALVWVRGNAGSDYFGVTSYGPGYSGPYTHLDLLANTADPYEGIHLIDYWYMARRS